MFRFPSNQSFELFEVHAGKKYGDCRSVATSGGNWMELVLSPLCIYHNTPLSQGNSGIYPWLRWFLHALIKTYTLMEYVLTCPDIRWQAGTQWYCSLHVWCVCHVCPCTEAMLHAEPFRIFLICSVCNIYGWLKVAGLVMITIYLVV